MSFVVAPLHSTPTSPDRSGQTLANRVRRRPLYIPSNQLRIVRPDVHKQVHMLPPNRDRMRVPVHLLELVHHRITDDAPRIIVESNHTRHLRRRVHPQARVLSRGWRTPMIPRAIHPVPDRPKPTRIARQPRPKRRPRDVRNTTHSSMLLPSASPPRERGDNLSTTCYRRSPGSPSRNCFRSCARLAGITSVALPVCTTIKSSHPKSATVCVGSSLYTADFSPS